MMMIHTMMLKAHLLLTTHVRSASALELASARRPRQRFHLPLVRRPARPNISARKAAKAIPPYTPHIRLPFPLGMFRPTGARHPSAGHPRRHAFLRQALPRNKIWHQLTHPPQSAKTVVMNQDDLEVGEPRPVLGAAPCFGSSNR